MPEPSIKGSIIEKLVADLAQAVADGVIPRESLELRLQPEDIALFDEKINPAKWYSLASFQRLSQLLSSQQDGDRVQFLQARGVAAADRLMDAGIYQQLAAEGGSVGSGVQTRQDLLRNLRLRFSLMGGLISVGVTHIEVDEDPPARAVVEIREASEIPDELGHNMVGFVSRVAERTGDGGRAWTFRRTTPDVMRFESELL